MTIERKYICDVCGKSSSFPWPLKLRTVAYSITKTLYPKELDICSPSCLISWGIKHEQKSKGDIDVQRTSRS